MAIDAGEFTQLDAAKSALIDGVKTNAEKSSKAEEGLLDSDAQRAALFAAAARDCAEALGHLD